MSWDEIPGWTDEWLLKVYDEAIIEAENGSVFVEIGTAFGRSAAYMATQILASKKKIQFFAVDPWAELSWLEPSLKAHVAKHGGFYEAFEACLNEHAPESKNVICPIRLKSETVALSMGPVEFCFIDADHDYESVKSDISAWRKNARILAGHDHISAFPEVQKAVSEAFPDGYERIGSCWRKVLA
jgi:hypothetical protein